MIKVKEKVFEEFDGDTKKVRVSLVADTKEEVQSIGTNGDIKGLTENEVMTLGSTCLCVTGDFGILGSDGVWSF